MRLRRATLALLTAVLLFAMTVGTVAADTGWTRVAQPAAATGAELARSAAR